MRYGPIMRLNSMPATQQPAASSMLSSSQKRRERYWPSHSKPPSTTRDHISAPLAFRPGSPSESPENRRTTTDFHYGYGMSKKMIRIASGQGFWGDLLDRKSTRLNSSHVAISYAVFC